MSAASEGFPVYAKLDKDGAFTRQWDMDTLSCFQHFIPHTTVPITIRTFTFSHLHLPYISPLFHHLPPFSSPPLVLLNSISYNYSPTHLL